VSGFEERSLYQDAQRLIKYVYAIEDRFPEEDRLSLHRPMRDQALEIGARIAAGFSCLGDSISSMLPEENRKEVLSRLGEVRHWVLTAETLHHLDADKVQEFTEIHDAIREELGGGTRGGHGA